MCMVINLEKHITRVVFVSGFLTCKWIVATKKLSECFVWIPMVDVFR